MITVPTVFVVTVGEPSTEECIKRVRAQDTPTKLDVIENMAPTSTAMNAMLDRCSTDTFVQVDADMLLEPWAVKYAVQRLTARPSNVAQFYTWLWGDAEERPIGQLKACRHAPMNTLRFRNVPHCDGDYVDRLRAAGWLVLADPPPASRKDCVGLHYGLQTPERAYSRFYRLALRYRARPKNLKWLEPILVKLRNRSESESTPMNRAAYYGALAGLTATEQPAGEDDYRRPTQGFADLEGLICE